MFDRREALAAVTAAVMGTGSCRTVAGDQKCETSNRPVNVGPPQENATTACLACRAACRAVLQQAAAQKNEELVRCCQETIDHCRQVIRLLRRQAGSSAAICQACADACARLVASAENTDGRPELSLDIDDVKRCRLACEEVVLAGR